MAQKTPHSAEQFGKQRDEWWNADFFSLLCSRWNMCGVKSIADIGCGLGHWSSLLLNHLDPGSHLVGVDREQQWVLQAASAIKGRLEHHDDYKLEFHQGTAEKLPLENEEFDVVTCQTVLMHLPNPKAGLEEMIRVAKPGGLILCVEPDNFLNYLNYDSLTEDRPLDELVEEYRFWLCVHRGRIKAGEGNDSIGRLLPGLFAELGLEQIEVALSDKASPIVPPYNTPAEKELLTQLHQWHSTSTGPFDFAALRRYAGLVEPDQTWIDVRLTALSTSFDRQMAAIDQHRLHSAGGGLLFLVWGRKP